MAFELNNKGFLNFVPRAQRGGRIDQRYDRKSTLCVFVESTLDYG